MRCEIELLFAKLSKHLPILEQSSFIKSKLQDMLLKSPSVFLPESDSQCFFLGDTPYYTTEIDLQKIDYFLKVEIWNCLDFSYKHSALDPAMVTKFSDVFSAFLLSPQFTKQKHYALLFSLTSSNFIFFGQLISRIVINLFKEKVLEQPDNFETSVKRNDLSMNLGRGFISAVFDQQLPNYKHVFFSFVAQFDDVTLLLSTFGLQQFKKHLKIHAKNLIPLAKLLLFYFVETSYKDIYNAKDRSIFRTGPFSQILVAANNETSVNATENFQRINSFGLPTNILLNKHLCKTLSIVRRVCDSWGRFFGDSLVNFFVERGLFCYSCQNLSFKYVVLKDISLLFSVSRYLCRFASQYNFDSLQKSNSNINITIAKPHPLVKKKDPLILADLLKTNSKHENTRYAVNLPFLKHFLTLFLQVLESPHDVTTNQVFQHFLSEIYGFNVNAFFKDPICSKQLIELLTNFKNLSSNKVILRHHTYYIKKITAMGLSKKCFLNELLFQLHLSFSFNFFYFDFYHDYRGRLYPLQSVLTTYSPLSRLFLCLYYTPPKLNVTQNNENKNLLVTLLNSYCYKVFPIVPSSFQHCLVNPLIKLGSRSAYFISCCDYFSYDDPFKKLHGFFSLDSRTSGVQMLAIATKSRSLAVTGNLTATQDFDIYLSSKDHCISYFCSVSELFHHLSRQELKYFYKFFLAFSAFSTSLKLQKKSSINPKKKNDVFSAHLAFILKYIHNTAYPGLSSKIFALLEKQNYINIFVSKAFQLYLRKHVLNTSPFSLITFNHVLLLSCSYSLVKLRYLLRKPYVFSKISRDLMKRVSMTTLYGSTIKGAQEQLLCAFVDSFYYSTRLLSDKLYTNFGFFCKFLAKVVHQFLQHAFPDAFKLLNYIRNAKRSFFLDCGLKSPYFFFNYVPVIRELRMIKLQKRCFRIIIDTDQHDLVASRNQFCANFCQFLDATLVFIFSENYLYPSFTIHDRFFCGVHFSLFLQPTLMSSYVSLFDLNLLHFNFYGSPLYASVSPNENLFLTHDELKQGLLTSIFCKP